MHSDSTKFSDYEKWRAFCAAQSGWHGPYGLASQAYAGFYQFVKDGEGTMALWNGKSRTGYAFAIESAQT